jgi:hypothetical protein
VGFKFRVFSATLSVTLMLSLSAGVHGEMPPLQVAHDIRSMFDASQEVLIGTVTGVHVLHEKPLAPNRLTQGPMLQQREGIVEVRQIYKGSLVPAVRVGFEVQIPPSFTGPALENGETGLLFLVSTGDGRYAFASSEWAYFRLPYFQPSNGGDGSGPELLEKDLDASLAGDQRGVQDTLRLLMTFHHISDATEERVARLTEAQDVPIATGAFAVLLNAGKDEYYPRLVKFLSGRGASAHGLEFMVIFGHVQAPGPNADPKIFDQLSMLPEPSIKLAAILALRKIGSSESVPTLIAHLDDSNRRIQYLAVIALHDILAKGDDFGPSNFDFDRSPQMYVERWKQWWDQEGRAQHSH